MTGAQIPPQHRPSSALWSIVRLYSWSQALSAATLAVIILARRAGGPAHWAGDLTGLQQTALLGQVANAINVAAVGAVIFSSIECGYSALSLAAWLLINILRTILPPSVAPLPFDARGWPRLMQHPQRSTSLHEFWGKRWHALFKRIFVHDGSKTLSRLARGVGAGKLFTSAAAVMGAFIVSGWMHESCGSATRSSNGSAANALARSQLRYSVDPSRCELRHLPILRVSAIGYHRGEPLHQLDRQKGEGTVRLPMDFCVPPVYRAVDGRLLVGEKMH